MQEDLEGLRLETAADRPAVARGGKPCARVSDPILQARDAQLNHVDFELSRAIKGREMAGLLFNRERQLRKEDANRHMVELEKVRGIAEDGRTQISEYESRLEQMHIKLAATENELRKSQHLVSSLRKEVESHAADHSNEKEEQAAEDAARVQCVDRLENLTATWDAFKESQARSNEEALAAVHANEVTIYFDSDAGDSEGAPGSLSPNPPTFSPTVPQKTAMAPETDAPDLCCVPLAKKTAMAPETSTGAAPDLSSVAVPSLSDEEHSSNESTAICSTPSLPSAASAPQSDSERSEVVADSGGDNADEIGSAEDDPEKDESDDKEKGVSSTSGSCVSAIPQARADSQPPQYILDNWATCSSSSSSSSSPSSSSSSSSSSSTSSNSSTPQALADSELPPHILNNWAPSSSS
ncbi:unnamed protein product, partial [Laminaria digitata]